MKYFVPILLFLFFLTACTWQKETQSRVTKIEIDPKQSNQADILQIIKSVELIPLETNDNSIFGNIKRVRADGNHLYILDYNDNPVKIFTKNGKFVAEIGHRGRGPGEYIQIDDFLISEDVIHIYAWSGNRKWIRYSFDNRFLYETDMFFPLDEICQISDNRYLIYVGNGTVSNECDYYLYCIDKDFEIQSRLQPKRSPEDINFPIQQNHFSKSSDCILYIREFCDTLFTISHDLTIQPKYRLDFGKNWYSNSFLKEYHGRSFFEIYNAVDKNEYAKHINVLETSTQLIISYIIQHDIPLGKRGRAYLAIYSNETENIYNYADSHDNIFAKLFLRPYLVDTDGDQIIGLIDAEEILDIASKINIDNPIAEKVKKCAEQIDKSSNPILIRYTLADGESRIK